ncbi:hypothetical protein CSC12_5410 [Klebsiella michiganensis]|nr:hypothetical protein CSC12_5410 [Klebsiella michiganensis]
MYQGINQINQQQEHQRYASDYACTHNPPPDVFLIYEENRQSGAKISQKSAAGV